MIVAQGALNSDSGAALAHVALGIIGSFILVILAFRALAAFADERYGKIVTCFLAAVPVFGFAYLPDQTRSLLSTLWSMFAGGG
ncbi:hypothetical protein [Labedaea rhizosphaerae]|uniref:Uncharacterized protein n=1 Tax=Labedaea rhizosphaerae TaxID=598644 RepID=A0A4R6SI16_LABRH|nr:hypothetical protein [Labedaea rhizosphaerae]TDQ00598.1 hypothetical protein EV186_102459 [Labedaea rhizosphaerae]